MNEGLGKNIKVKQRNLYFTFAVESKTKKFIFYFRSAYGY